MKKLITNICLCFCGLMTQATTHIVTVSNNQFSPANIPNVLVGDVIQFNFAAVNFHNVITNPMGQVPAGAADINSGSPGSVTTSYSYTVTRAGSYRYYCQVHSDNGINGMVGTFTASGVVPVQLINLQVLYSNNAVIAKWQTASEQNLSHFIIQKSTNGNEYLDVGRVEAIGNSDNIQSYNFIDEKLGTADRYFYYMIKAVEKNGDYSFSAIKLIRNEKARKKLITSIGPNPISKSEGHCMFQFNADIAGEMNATVVDANGRALEKLSLSAEKGINNGHIHMGIFPPGIYQIIFSMDGLKEIKRVVVTK